MARPRVTTIKLDEDTHAALAQISEERDGGSVGGLLRRLALAEIRRWRRARAAGGER